MKTLCLGLVAASVGLAFASAPASAREYPWCAQYGATASAPTNCGFVSYRQCMATVSGVGGFCVRNPFYQPQAKRRHMSDR